jgi:iron complex outermembrane receptor protein
MALFASSRVYSDDASTAPLDTVVVQDKALTTEGAARAHLADIPGGASLISAEVFEKGRVASASDILAFQPGVYAQTAQGSDGLKISIRGSGINRGTGFFRSGTQFYFDGLPLTGAGGTPYELFEPLGLGFTEVLRGGNAFDYGSVALGGAINYVTRTGRDFPHAGIRTEFGSFDYYKGQLEYGGVSGSYDFYVSLTGSKRNGFQEHSQSETRGVVANFGYAINPSVDTRFYIRYRRTDNETPGFLRQKDIEQDATLANPQNLQQNARRLQPGSTWLANKTTIRFDGDSQLKIGVVYHDYPIEINPDPAPGNIALPADGSDGPNVLAPNARLTNSTWWYSDLAATLDYTRSDSLLGRESKSSVSLVSTYHPAAGVKIYENNPNVTTGPNAFDTLVKKANYDGSSDTVFRLGNDTEVLSDLWLTTGVALVSIRRATEFEYVAPSVVLPPNYEQKFSRTTTHVAPRAGLRFNVSPDFLVFGNVTRSVEPPNSWSPSNGSGVGAALNTVNNLGNGFITADIKDQTATSYELGARAKHGIFQGSLSLYHTDVKNELLSVQVAPGPPPVTRELNGSPTQKEGVEAGLDVVLWNPRDSGDAFDSKTRVLFRQAFTLNDFRYKGDATYGTNELPGIPGRFYQGEVLFEHSRGFYAGASVQYGSSTYVDYANTFEVDPYTIYGLNFGYDEPGGRWQAYLDVRNLTDKNYTVSVSPVFDTRLDPSASADTPQGRPNDLYLLSPGDGFGVFGGLSVRF